jgi:hypothetical protein
MTDVPRDQPDAAGLIAIARTTFLGEIQPFLKDELRLTGLMIANALAIAERELRAPDPGLLDAEPLVHAIRAGRHDGDAGLHALLRDDARRRLEISNPRYLKDT